MKVKFYPEWKQLTTIAKKEEKGKGGDGGVDKCITTTATAAQFSVCDVVVPTITNF